MTRTSVRTLAAFGVLVLASCLGDSTGPEMRRAHVSFAPVFDSRALLVVDVNRVMIRLTRPADGSKALEKIVDFPSTSDTLTLNVDVPVSGTSEQFALTLIMIDDPQVIPSSGPDQP